MAGEFIDSPAPKGTGLFIDTPPPRDPSMLDKIGGVAHKVGDAVNAGYRNFQGARTAAARDPVGALGNVLGAAEGAVAGAVMEPIDRIGRGRSLQGIGRGAIAGATDPAARDRYNREFGDMVFDGLRPQGNSMPARIGRGVEDFALQTMADPVTHGGAKAISGLAQGAQGIGRAAARTIKPVGEYADRARKVAADKTLGPAVKKVAGAIRDVNPIPGMVNAGKDVLFLNPFPHGLGNMTVLDFLRNGPRTTAQGLRYGITGTPPATKHALERIGAEAWTPELMGQPSPWGPVGWMNALGKAGVPAGVRAGTGAAAGGGIGYGTSPATDTPQQRASRAAEGAIIGAITGGSPEVLNASNKIMSRLEQGHRGAMLEKIAPDLLKPAERAAPKAAPATSAPSKIRLKPSDFTVDSATGEITLKPVANPDNLRGRQMYTPLQRQPAPRIKPTPDLIREPSAAEKAAADAINSTFGGGKKGNLATIATALGGPFAQWQAEVVPRNVGRALANAPARVEGFARGQDITNRDVLGDQPYKAQVGGPIGAFSELVFNPQKYAARLAGPLGNIDPSQATNPQSFSLGDAARGVAYNAVPGRNVVGPFFGDTMFPQKAPAIPSATVDTLLGWYFRNRTPRQDAIHGLMQATGLDAFKATQVYDRYRR